MKEIIGEINMTKSQTQNSGRSFVVTLQAGQAASRQIWDGAQGFEIGFPARWVIEAKGAQVVVRETKKGGATLQTLSLGQLENGDTTVALVKGMSLSIRATQVLAPLFNTHPTGAQATAPIRVYSMRGRWAYATTTVETASQLRIGKDVAFELAVDGAQIRVTPKVQSLAWTNAKTGAQSKLEIGKSLSLSRTELSGNELRAGLFSWRLEALDRPAGLAFLDSESLARGTEKKSFQRSLAFAVVALFLFCLTAALWPKADKDELLPEQFAKIVLNKKIVHAYHKASQGSQGGSGPAQVQKQAKPKVASHAKKSPVIAQTKAPKKAVHVASHVAKVKAKPVQHVAVAKPRPAKPLPTPFQSKSLQSMANSLLKGGMTPLLDKSDIASGNAGRAEGASLSGRRGSSTLGGGAPSAGAGDLGGGAAVRVASLGGGGEGGGSGRGVGYGKGARAGVSGQGRSFVGMDDEGGDVAEGLSMDEVGAVIQKHMREIRYCYESAVVRDPGVGGKLGVHFVVGLPGSVSSAHVNQSTLRDSELNHCVIRRLVTWKFPKPRGSSAVAVNYPFLFKTLGR